MCCIVSVVLFHVEKDSCKSHFSFLSFFFIFFFTKATPTTTYHMHSIGSAEKIEHFKVASGSMWHMCDGI